MNPPSLAAIGRSGRILVPIAILSVPSWAHAELDEGEVYLTSHSTNALVAYVSTTTATDEFGRAEHSEHWVASASFVSRLGSTGFRVNPGPAPATPTGPCGAVLAFDATYTYGERSPTEALALVDEEEDGWEAAFRVREQGEDVGWRLVALRGDGSVREAWLLSERYAPPLPTRTARPWDAFQLGWTRPYADLVDVLPAPLDEARSELLAGFVGSTLLLADVRYRPQLASPTDRRRFCVGAR